jgi:hypothetical protein
MLKKPVFVIIGISLLLTVLVSILFGLASALMFKTFWGGFVGGVALQVIVFAIHNSNLLKKDQFESIKLANEQLDALSKFTLKLACAYCKTSAIVPIKLNEENRFTCEYCKQVSGVKMQFVTTQVTTPLEKVVMPVGSEDSIEFKVTN